MIYNAISLSPLGALATDAVATFVTQFAYCLMKLSQISRETVSDEDSNGSITKSGFCTCYWAVGFSLVMIASTVHACKSISFALNDLFSCATIR